MSDDGSLDRLQNEVTIAAKIEQSGVSVQAKSRAVAAFDRLLGSIADMPAAIFEGVARRSRLKQEIEERLRRAEAATAEKLITEDEEIGLNLINDVLREKARKQINVAGVGLETLDALRLPDLRENSVGQDRDEAPKEIDPDWMNFFARHAEEVSAEDIQNIWGRVLAGEINKPGSFSRATLRFISEIDRDTIAACEQIASVSLGGFIRKPEDLKGEKLQTLLDLQSAGIVEQVGSLTYSWTMTVGDDGRAFHLTKRHALILEGQPGTTGSVRIIGITRVGREVFSLLQPIKERQELIAFAEAVPKTALTKVTVAEFSRAPGGLMTTNPYVVWEAPQ